MVPACRSIDTISVFAPSVDAALAVQRVIAGYDATDPYSRAAPFPHLRRSPAAPVVRVRYAGLDLCEPAIAATAKRAADLLGAEPVDITPFLEIARLLYDGPWVAERTAALADVPFQHCHPVTRAILESGLTRRTVDAFDAFHRLAQVRRLATELFAGCDALLLPTAPFCPTLAELEADPIGPNSRLGTFTNFVNLCDLAAIAVPAGFGPDGLPVGVTLLGPSWSEGRLAALADRVHREFATTVGATSLPLPPPATPDALAPEETALFCVGGHMAGLPLNGQITALGGRFLHATRTAPSYRLHDLGDRPGMIRAAGGRAIEGEVWALPTVSIGALLAQVPFPLGFGTVALSGGPCLGFLAEAEGVTGAPDITSFGGWRGFLAAR
jgi:allophanate hydrolase